MSAPATTKGPSSSSLGEKRLLKIKVRSQDPVGEYEFSLCATVRDVVLTRKRSFFSLTSFFFILLVLLVLLRVIVAFSRVRERDLVSPILVTHLIPSRVNNAEEDARRRTNERANLNGFTRFFPFSLSLSLTLCPQQRFDAVLLLRLFNLGER